jgi:hypothetical protein
MARPQDFTLNWSFEYLCHDQLGSNPEFFRQSQPSNTTGTDSNANPQAKPIISRKRRARNQSVSPVPVPPGKPHPKDKNGC